MDAKTFNGLARTKMLAHNYSHKPRDGEKQIYEYVGITYPAELENVVSGSEMNEFGAVHLERDQESAGKGQDAMHMFTDFYLVPEDNAQSFRDYMYEALDCVHFPDIREAEDAVPEAPVNGG